MPSALDRLRDAVARANYGHALEEAARKKWREAEAEIREIHQELLTGEPSRPLLDELERKAEKTSPPAPPPPRGETDYHGRRQRTPRAERADRRTKDTPPPPAEAPTVIETAPAGGAPAPDPWAGTDGVRCGATRGLRAEVITDLRERVLPELAREDAEGAAIAAGMTAALNVMAPPPSGAVAPRVARKGIVPARSLDDVPAPVGHAGPERQAAIGAVVDDRRVPRPAEGWSDLRILNAIGRLGDQAVLCERCQWIRATAAIPCPNCKTSAARPARGDVGARRKPK